VNNSWFIFDIGFIPWFGWPTTITIPVIHTATAMGMIRARITGSSYYDQSATYDRGGYNNYYGQPNDYDQGNSNSYDQAETAWVLTSEQRWPTCRINWQEQVITMDKIDGVVGPETRYALLRYQRDKGLGLTGSLTMERGNR